MLGRGLAVVEGRVLFHFELRLLRDVMAWGPASPNDARREDWERRPHVNWYGLMDGWYWIDAGGAELLRYSQAELDTVARLYPGELWVARNVGVPYVDYQVAQFWQDVIDIVPDVLEPIPTWLARTLEPTGAWTEWHRRAEKAVMAALPKPEARNLLNEAGRWQRKRSLDTWYLSAAPAIWFWSDGANVHIEWDNRERYLHDSVLTWEAVLGHHALTVEAFRDEARSFNARFTRRMWDRTAIAQADWPRPDVALSPHLNAEHRQSARYMRHRLEIGVREPDDWEAVFRAIAAIEALPIFPPEARLRVGK